jgi:hypothetical protein
VSLALGATLSRASLLVSLVAAPLSAQVTADRPLAFGTVVSGTTTAVTKTSASAAQWKIHGSLLFAGGFQLTLPASLTGPGTAIPLTFSASDGIYKVNSSSPTGGTVFNPQNFVLITPILTSLDVYVWLGASLTTPLNQAPGSYSGTVVLTVTGLL